MSKRKTMEMRRDVLAASIYRDSILRDSDDLDRPWDDIAKERALVSIDLANIFIAELAEMEKKELHDDVI